MTAEWRPDPEGKHEYRWWDGQAWTDQVADQGQVSTAAMGGGGAPAGQSAGAQGQPDQGQWGQGQPGQGHPGQGQPGQGFGGAPGGGGWGQGQPGQGQPGQGQPGQGQPGGYGGQQGGGDNFAGISGDLVSGHFSERDAQPIANQNSKLLRVRLGEPFLARQGAMVAYQGDVQFAFQGGGAAKFLKKALTGEGLPLMQCTGRGDVFLANLAYDVHVLQLTNSGLSVSGKNVLAFSSSLEWNVERVKGASIAAGGLFNTTLRGTGWVAITTDGPPVVLNAAEAPTFADTDAIVAWSAHLQTQLKSSFSAGALIGRGSGELVQVAFHGQGFVIVQPSEGFKITAAG